ncbi:PQQ-dependent sugar dehydrogenase [Flagellimonas sp.]|uniref:PQQ-dependent sugar dehydrogenase n=1 Tax=Flagellimonas sp. TaxID=2058762 RepID=UPI003B516984
MAIGGFRSYFLYFAMTLLFLIGCSQKKKAAKAETTEIPKEETADSTTLAAKVLFEAHCSGCHGQQMEAFADRKWSHGKGYDSIKKSITEGYINDGMPSWKTLLSEKEIDNLTLYIRKGVERVERYGVEKNTLTSDTLVTETLTIKLDTIFSGIEVPWDLNWLPNGDMLVTERAGRLFRVDAAGRKFIIKGVPEVRHKTQAGLFEVLPHPNFKENNFVYLSFANPKVEKNDTTVTTMVRRYTLKNDQLSDDKLIFDAAPYNKRHVHFGARMLFDDDGYLFVTIGDRGERDINPQDLSKVGGKIHRFHDDGSVPKDNPFFNSPNAVKSIYSYGHRNQQGIAFHPSTKALWEHEHGPRGGDEINIINVGKNYGWPIISYGLNYDGTVFTNMVEKEGMESPLHNWTPSIAPCGMTFVTSNRYPGWQGNLLAGSLRFEYLNRCVLEGNKIVKEEKLFEGIGRLRNVEQGPDGYLYISVETPGYVFKLLPLLKSKKK